MKLVCLMLVLLYPLGLLAEVYKWVDEEGAVHYGDRPDNSGAVKVQIDTATVPVMKESAPREENRQRISDSMEEDRLARQAEREKKQQEREKKLKECNSLRDRQKRFQAANGLYRLDKSGQRVFMSVETRKKTEQDLQKKIQQVCG